MCKTEQTPLVPLAYRLPNVTSLRREVERDSTGQNNPDLTPNKRDTTGTLAHGVPVLF
jgi:hypothetical protein